MIKFFIGLLSIAVLAVTSYHISYAEMQVPPVPLDGYVLDQTNTLTPEHIATLNEQISDYKSRTSVQLAVLMVPEISQDDYLERYSLNVARTWGVGEKDKNNGALLLIAKKDKKLRIEVGTGLEGDLTDARSGRIIRDRIAPEFKQGKYYEGIKSGLDGISLAIGESDDPLLASSSESEESWMSNLGDITQAVFFIGFFGLSWLGSILGRTKSWWAGGILGGVTGGAGSFFLSGGNIPLTLTLAGIMMIFGLGFDYIVSKNYKRASDGGYEPSWWAGGTTLGGGGSSGGGGFGGGGFGGGGASGDW